MWSLVMGSLISSDSEDEWFDDQHHNQEENQDLEETTTVLQHKVVNMADDGATHSGPEQDDANTTRSKIVQNESVSHQVPISDLHRREDGDGMEKPVLVKTPSEIFKAASIVLPETGVALDKIPPISDKVDLRPVNPTSALVKEKAKVYPKGTLPPAVKKSKEAKFVPCEPYKGAVSPLSDKSTSLSGKKVSSYGSRRSPEKTLSAQNLNQNTSVSPRRQQDYDSDSTDPLFTLNLSSVSVDNRDGSVQDSVNTDVSVEDGGEEEMNPRLRENYRLMLEVKEKELNRLKFALGDAEKQLRIQSQVNGELKNLLVASVGEDIEARLDFLTQDKARLAADLVHYNNKISRDWEEKEALHVESDIWRSKFLASTVILEELTRSKQALESRNHQLEHTARRILLERKESGGKLHAVEFMLRSLLPSLTAGETVPGGAADHHQVPGGVADHHNVEQVADLHSLCSNIESSTLKICDKLAGDKGLRYTTATEPEYKLSEAERDMEQLLVTSQRHEESHLPDQASCRLTQGARTLLMKMGDKAQSPGKSAFNSCSHCNGTVETV